MNDKRPTVAVIPMLVATAASEDEQGVTAAAAKTRMSAMTLAGQNVTTSAATARAGYSILMYQACKENIFSYSITGSF